MIETLAADVVGPTVAEAQAFLRSLALPSPAADDHGRIDRIRVLEDLEAALAAAQARETVVFKASQVAAQRAAGVPARDLGKGISAQVALARRESPHRGARYVGLADALVNEMPYTMAALTAGQLSEWRATIVCKETACLSREDRREVDARLAGRLPCLSDHRVEAEARTHAYTLDPQSVLNRARKAATDRRVTLRPAPDTMSTLSALLPATQGVACLAALRQAAATGKATGDPRSRGQIMADTLVERITGQTRATHTPLEVQLVMTDTTLLADDDTPARLLGYGPIPATVARHLIADLPDHIKTWIRRVYIHPVTGRLTQLETHRRLFTHTLRRLLILRDDDCRTPYCGAPIRHTDHPIPTAHGGPTSEANGQGLCEACNHTKEAPGWHTRPDPHGGAGHSITITTPTGHTYTTTPPPLPGAPPGTTSPRAAPTSIHGSPVPRIDICYLPYRHHAA